MKENGVHWLVFSSQMDALKGLIMKKILFLLYILLLGTTVVRAQRVSRDFRNVTMPTALQQLGGITRRYTINFIYNDSTTRGSPPSMPTWCCSLPPTPRFLPVA